MDKRPIGVFDSGLGGLTAVRRLRQVLPGEDIVYLGDTSRVPYGSRSLDTIRKYAGQDAAFLMSFDIKALVVACGTVSTTSLPEVAARCGDVPVFGVVEATARAAAQATRNGRVGLIATQASIRSGAYGPAIRRYAPEAEIFDQACPLFVPLVENGRTEPGDIVIETVAREYLAPLREAGVDTLVLGCTHYPLLSRVIGDVMGPGVTLVDSGAATAEAVAETLRAADALSGRDTVGEQRYFVTDSTDGFGKLASMFLGGELRGQVTQVSLEQY